MSLVILISILICQSTVEASVDVPSVPSDNSKPIKAVTNNGSIDDPMNLAHLSEDGLLDFMGLAKKYCRKAEEYDIVTEDGYILKVFRIRGNTSNVILLSHGFLDSSDSFIVRGKTSWVYTLNKEDYDVWVINYRGNRYSRRHKTLNPDISPEFWHYSMEEFGLYDLPAVIDFILRETGVEKLSIVGHSEGSASVLVLMSQRPEYNDRIKIFVAMAPACYLKHSGIAIRTLVELGTFLASVFRALSINELLGYNSLSYKLYSLMCAQGTVGYEVCVDRLFGAISGYGSENLEPQFLFTILGHYPAGTSRRNAAHYVQIAQKHRFARFDYGDSNRVMYGSEKPPKYNMKNVTCDVAVVGASNDLLISLKDVERVKNELPNVVDYHVVVYDKFTHLDYVWGLNANKVLHPIVMKILNKYK